MDVVHTLDLFHPRFDEAFKLVNGRQVIFSGHSAVAETLPPSGIYRDSSRFGDSIGEVGFVVPAGFKRLEVIGTDPALVRSMIVEIRTGRLSLAEQWD
jgi:hypothetical protein